MISDKGLIILTRSQSKSKHCEIESDNDVISSSESISILFSSTLVNRAVLAGGNTRTTGAASGSPRGRKVEIRIIKRSAYQ